MPSLRIQTLASKESSGLPFWGWSFLLLSLAPQTSKHSWAGGGGDSLTTFYLVSHVLSQKSSSWLAEEHEGTQVLWGFIKLANINTSLLKTSGSSLSVWPSSHYFSPGALFWPKQFRARSLKGILFLKWAVCKIVDLLASHWQTLSGLI